MRVSMCEKERENVCGFDVQKMLELICNNQLH